MKEGIKALVNPYKTWVNMKWRYFTGDSKRPFIFVVGAPRSGTTLLYSILKAHPEISGADEETYFFVFRNYKKKSFSGFTRSGCLKSEEYNKILLNSKNLVNQYERIADYFHAKENTKYFIEKTPSHLFHMKYLLKKFPNARIINIVRDGRDCYLSHLKLEGHLHRGLKSFALLWKSYINHRQKFLGHSRIIDVRYEDIASEPVKQAKHVMQFLNISFNPDQLKPQRNEHSFFLSIKGHSRLSAKIDTQSVNKWKEALNASEKEAFLKIAKKQLHVYGYEN